MENTTSTFFCWKNPKIAGVFLDVESVMKSYSSSKVAQRELAELIRSKIQPELFTN